ncbi:hypothetical protein ACP70R_041150 [Stipagrostis hirtigluma subsp. patula]
MKTVVGCTAKDKADCAKEIDPEKMHQLEKEIPILLCKLEKMFPPGFFNVMQHLIVHLPYEARVGGPVAFRWMYFFERCNHTLKQSVGNRARVEACIVEAFIVREFSDCVSLYFADHVRTKWTKNYRYNTRGTCVQNDGCTLDVFGHSGTLHGRGVPKDLTSEELNAAKLYILTNCAQVDRFREAFEKEKLEEHPGIDAVALDQLMRQEFVDWFKQACREDANVDSDLRNLAIGCSPRVLSYNSYDVNGYRFRSERYERSRADLRTVNTGVCLTSFTSDDKELDYYGVIEDIIKLSFNAGRKIEIVLFQCRWYDPIHGVRSTPSLGLVEVKSTSRLSNFEPFAMAHQAVQVYYLSYPSKRRDLQDWLLVYKMRPPGSFAASSLDEPSHEDEFFQEHNIQEALSVDIGEMFDEGTAASNESDDVVDPLDIETIEAPNVHHSSEEYCSSEEVSSDEEPPMDNLFINSDEDQDIEPVSQNGWGEYDDDDY